MAYSPFDGGNLTSHAGLAEFAAARDMTAAQVALAWLLAHPGVIPIPKSASMDRVTENAAAAAFELDAADHAALDALFLPPAGPSSLQIY